MAPQGVAQVRGHHDASPPHLHARHQPCRRRQSGAGSRAAQALANTGHQSGWNVDWNDEGFQGSASECEGAGLDAGDVLWHFVQTRVPAGVSSGMLTATFGQAGEIAVDSYKRSAASSTGSVSPGQDTVLTYDSDVTSDGQRLNLSHICAAADGEESPEAPTDGPSRPTSPPPRPTSPPSPDRQAEPRPRPASHRPRPTSRRPRPTSRARPRPTSRPGPDRQAEPGPDRQARRPRPTSRARPRPTSQEAGPDRQAEPGPDRQAASPRTSRAITPAPSPARRAPTTSPTGESGGATGTPKVTPPPTDAIGGDTTGSGTGWLLAMIGLAALVVGLIVGMPSRRSRRQTPGRQTPGR